MSQFTLTFTDDDSTVTKTFKAVFIDEVVDHFDSFIRGCGYFPNGELGIVNPDSEAKNGKEPIADSQFFSDIYHSGTSD